MGEIIQSPPLASFIWVSLIKLNVLSEKCLKMWEIISQSSIWPLYLDPRNCPKSKDKYFSSQSSIFPVLRSWKHQLAHNLKNGIDQYRNVPACYFASRSNVTGLNKHYIINKIYSFLLQDLLWVKQGSTNPLSCSWWPTLSSQWLCFLSVPSPPMGLWMLEVPIVSFTAERDFGVCD